MHIWRNLTQKAEPGPYVCSETKHKRDILIALNEKIVLLRVE